MLEALEQLDPEITRVIWLHRVEGLSYKEISKVLGVRANTLAVREHRAIALLRKGIAASHPDFVSGTKKNPGSKGRFSK